MKLKQYLLTQDKETLFDLFSAEEEHDIATIVENPIYTWNLEFQEEWKDVLESEIIGFLPKTHNDVIKITVSGVAAERIEKFQFILAGYCGIDYYDKYHLKVE